MPKAAIAQRKITTSVAILLWMTSGSTASSTASTASMVIIARIGPRSENFPPSVMPNVSPMPIMKRISVTFDGVKPVTSCRIGTM